MQPVESIRACVFELLNIYALMEKYAVKENSPEVYRLRWKSALL